MCFKKLLTKIANKKYDKVLRCRYEENPALFYFRPDNFEGLKCDNYNVKGDKGQKLVGYFYYYGEPNSDRIIIFDHGIGAGHRAYLKEIEMLAKHGYTVYSYDHTGCCESEGKGIVGFPQSLNDLDHVITCLQADEKYKNASFSCIGHSWGAYSTLNIAAFHPEVTHIVSLSAYITSKVAMRQYLPDKFAFLMDGIFATDLNLNPKYAEINALDTIDNSTSKYLIFHSTGDSMINYEENFLPLMEKYKDRENVTFVSMEKRDHNPNYTVEAVNLMQDMKQKLAVATKKKQLKTKEQQQAFKDSFDWDKLTEQDIEVWKQIFDFLDN